MKTIAYQDKASGTVYIYMPIYPMQRSLFEQKRTERILAAMRELKHVGNIDIFLFDSGKFRKIAEHKM